MSRLERRLAVLATALGTLLLTGAMANEDARGRPPEEAAPQILPLVTPELGPAVEAAAPTVQRVVQTDPLAQGAAEAPHELSASTVQVRPNIFPLRATDDPDAILTEADLQPFFRDEPYLSAKARFDAGRYAEASALLSTARAVTAPARFLRAMSLLRAHEGLKAGAEFASLADDYAVLADRCHYHAGTALEEARDFPGAAEEYDKVDEGSVLYKESRRCLARVLRAGGDLKAAIGALDPLAQRAAPLYGWDFAGDSLFAVAEMQQAQGDRKGAAASFLKLWSEHPNSRYGDLALERAEKLKASPTVEQTIARGELLMEAHHNRRAIALLAPIHEAPAKTLSAEWLCRGRLALGKAYRKEREHSLAIQILKQVADGCEDPEVRARALYVAGTSASIVAPELAIDLYKELAALWPEHSFADDALFFAGEIELRLGRHREARATLLTMAKLYPGGDYRAEGLFKVYWIDRLEGRLDAGLRVLDRVEREYASALDTQDHERASYWKGRTLVELRRADEAVVTFKKLALAHPSTWYGMLARSRLVELAPEAGKAVLATLAADVPQRPFEFPAQRIQKDRHFTASLELIRLGLPQFAIDELLNVERTPLRAEPEPNALRVLVLLLSRLGEARSAHAIARGHLNGDLSGRFRSDTVAVWKTAYPQAFRDILEEECETAKTEPDLMQALMREESALDPNIHSWAGAVGLTQLMVPTANEVARDLGMKERITAQRLHDPRLNILFGATYMRKLLRRFDGNYALSLAAYNAGGGAVSSWLKSGRDRTLDEFVEEIPIAETRNYVKRVMRTYGTYRLLYAAKDKTALLPQQMLEPKTMLLLANARAAQVAKAEAAKAVETPAKKTDASVVPASLKVEPPGPKTVVAAGKAPAPKPVDSAGTPRLAP